MSTIRIKAKERNGLVSVKSLMKHPMETGLRKDKSGKKIPEHWIQDVVAEANGNRVFSVAFNTSISKDPYLAFAYTGKKGDVLRISWKDSAGKTDSAETMVK
ncbi:thiosulfate oxidation carrier complex protein SoxZ [Litorivicinus sp.]|jgi:sulfur-oxidizing protein SoxZ|nr:thiosulfate oxidation carrier complex protein SoxZ [Litorivicinus sp.]MDC1207795.1 thiosulfate oxidation carrier complex protein SoxZ [Litorivicinus sp.]MDC1239725.1 thiosulfate oxidation carrier complex protein SoxZ [Litorivicinus sp.]|tara:strand:- start:154 stop:459 length:306 start_codon:yes stop_codon:yes gene_type:complete